MTTLAAIAQTYHCRPSEILGIRDEWAAYQFDIVVLSRANEKPQPKRVSSKQFKQALMSAKP